MTDTGSQAVPGDGLREFIERQAGVIHDRHGTRESWRTCKFWMCSEARSALAAEPVASGALDVERLIRTLRLIHGDAVPLPNRPTLVEYAEIIARWYAHPDTAGEPGEG